MNEFLPPPVPAPLPPLPKTAAVLPEPPLHMGRLLIGLAIAVAAYDICFWKVHTWGFSVAVFFPVLAGMILINRESLGRKRTTGLALFGLLVGAAVAAAIETCFTNTMVLLGLTVALAGDTYFLETKEIWGRWISQGIAMLCAPARALWLAGTLIESMFRGGMGGIGMLVSGCLLALPALILALVFGSLLAEGNMVFGSWTESFFNWFWKELALYLDPERIFLWLLVAFFVLPLLRPSNISERWGKLVQGVPRLPEILPSRAAAFSSGMILVVLNLLFLVANAADALYLWSDHSLPNGVAYKAYVHEGVNALIVTVILSAFVLTTIFQQSLNVVGGKSLKILAYVWIVQNLFLIFSVSQKLRFYIIYYEMTVARLSTLIFLALVLAGFVLLTIKIARDKSIAWLVGGCILATFATFYVTQFMNLAGWSANYNVARMEATPWYRFDTETMCPWGPSVWPALRRAHELAPDDHDISEAFEAARKGQDYAEKTGLEWRYWREFSLRAYWNREALDNKK